MSPALPPAHLTVRDCARLACALFVVLAALMLGAAPSSAADRAFSKRFGTTDTGDVTLVGNTAVTCPIGAANCAAARNGTATGTQANNNGYSMEYVDVDADATTFSSSDADLSLPAGATVLFAGLYWGGKSSASDALRSTVRLDTPGLTGYQDVTATTFDTSSSDSNVYTAFADVTSQVAAGGSGAYRVGNVRVNVGSSDVYGGWSLVVAYRDAATPRHNMAVFDGLQSVTASNPNVSIPVSGLTTPDTGPVDARVGVVAYDGDLGSTGDSIELNGTQLSDSLNPATNFFNSTVSRLGTRITAKNPDYVNQLGLDVDVLTADGILAPGSTTATVDLTTGGETYLPQVMTFITESEIDPPETTITSGPSGLINDSTPTYSFSSDEAGSTFECRIDGGPWSSCNSPHTTSTLSDGPHTFEVRAVDLALNVDPTPDSRSITVDTTAPDTAITSGPSGWTSDSTPTWAFNSPDEPGATFECRLDGGSWGSCTSPHTTSSLGEGEHTFEVRALDGLGNADPTPASRTITVDTAVPDTTITSGPSGPTGDATPTWIFSSSQSGSTFECRIDGGGWTSCNSPYTSSTLSDGPHTFDVRATDPAGNVDPTPASRSITVDTTAPDTAITSGPSGVTGDPTPTFGFNSPDDAGATFECRVDGGSWSSCNSPHTTSNLGDGPHTFEVRAVDALGNTDPTPSSRSITVDTAAPDTTITSGPSGATNDPTPTWAFSSDEAGSTFECRIDGGSWSSCNSPHTTSTLSDGPHTFEVRATDPAGNVDPTPASRSVTVDASAPDTAITSGPAGVTPDPTPTFGFESPDDGGATFECRIDGGAWSPCASAHTSASLDDGDHTFEVRAVDALGNADPTPASRGFTVDTSPPDTTITSGPAASTPDDTPSFAFDGDKPGYTFECRIDDGPWTACTSPYTPKEALTSGDHTFEVRAIDSAGNRDPTPARRRVKITVPEPQVTSPAECMKRPILTWVRGKRIRRVEFYLDGKRRETVRRADGQGRWGARFDRRGLSPGRHEVRAKIFFTNSRKAPKILRVAVKPCLELAVSGSIETVRPKTLDRCVARRFRAFVRGDRIRRVVFRLDGKRVKTTRVADWRGRYWLDVDAAKLDAGAHELRARIELVRGSDESSRLLKLPFHRCGGRT